MDSKSKGDIGEQAVLLQLLKLGWNVLKPIGDRLPYDLAINQNDVFVKIQVKCAYSYRNGYNINNTRAKTNRKVYKFEDYTKDDFDFAIAYILETNEFYIFPVEFFIKFKGKVRIGNNKKNETYKNNWKLIEDYIAERCKGASVAHNH